MPITLSVDFSTETLQARREWHDMFKVMKGKNLIVNTLPSKTLIHIWQRNQKFSRQAKVKRIQYDPSSFITKAKGTSSGRKHNRRERLTENKPKTIKKTVIGSYISIITLNVNGLNVPTKRQRLAGQMKTCTYMHFHLPQHSAWLSKLYVIILYC